MIVLLVGLLVAAVVDKGSDTPNGNATNSEGKIVKDEGDTSDGEAYEYQSVKKAGHACTFLARKR
jgi:hypothetical protein